MKTLRLILSLSKDEATFSGFFSILPGRHAAHLKHQGSLKSMKKQSSNGLHILTLVSEGQGSVGGIAQYNRDLLYALSQQDSVEAIRVLPRLSPGAPGNVHPKIRYDLRGVGGFRSYAAAVSRLALHLRIDLIICGHINLMPVACVLGSLRNVPVLTCIHGIDAWTPPPRAVVRHLSNRARYVLSVSEYTRDRFVNWSHYPTERVICLPNTFRAEEFCPGDKPGDLLERYKLGGRKVVLTFGRLVGESRAKGFDRVLEAMPGLIARDSSICYLIAGQGPDRARLEAKAEELGVRSHCVFTGYVEPDRKADIFRLADAFVMPSKGEGFGIVLLEAMACGIPVVGSTEDGTKRSPAGRQAGPVGESR